MIRFWFFVRVFLYFREWIISGKTGSREVTAVQVSNDGAKDGAESSQAWDLLGGEADPLNLASY